MEQNKKGTILVEKTNIKKQKRFRCDYCGTWVSAEKEIPIYIKVGTLVIPHPYKKRNEPFVCSSCGKKFLEKDTNRRIIIP